ncbi:MAG: lipid A export permease/ATP-binding protein MsbA [Alphaproteobacteria bacterium]
MTEPTATADREAPATTTYLVRRLARESVRPHLGRLLVAVLCMSIVAATTAANAWILEPILDKIFVEKNATLLWVMPVAVLTLAVVKGLATYAQAVLMAFVGQRIITDIQVRMFGHLMRADLAFFHNTSTGRLISRFTNDVNMLRAAVSTALTGIAKDALTLVFLVALMFYQQWDLALIAFVAFPVAVIPIARIGQRIRGVSTNTQEQMGHFTTLLDETFQGARHVRAYGMEDYETGRARRLAENVFLLIMKATRVRSISHPIMESLGGVAVTIIILYGGIQVIDGATTPGTFFSFIAALIMAYQPLKNLAKLNANLQEGLAAAQRIFALLDLEPQIRDAPDAAPLNIDGGVISFSDVQFAYTDNKPALHGVTFDVPAGKRAALVGPSGAGKSTILNLIPRFYDVDAGAVRIDGQDVRETTLASLRAAIGLVSQEVTLFDDTVRANIAYGKANATDDEIAAAARAAAAHDFIMDLPEGYDTPVGEHGIKLSGGQRQRLAIARAMLKDAPILLLDEATSALDTESERHIQSALNDLMKGRTSLVIAHRLSTVIGADVIYVIENGRIVESGDHAALLAREGIYARLYALQFADQAEIADPSRAAAGNPAESSRVTA